MTPKDGIVFVYPNRCGLCKKFKGNNIKCQNDTLNRGNLYANDYKCGNFDGE